MRAIHDALRQILWLLGWLLFWWSAQRRERFIPDPIEALGDDYMRDLLEASSPEEEDDLVPNDWEIMEANTDD